MSDKSAIPPLARTDRREVWRSNDTTGFYPLLRVHVTAFTIGAFALALGAVFVGCAGGGSKALPPAGTTTQSGSSPGSRSPHDAPPADFSPAPWWSGDCDVNNNPGSYRLGANAVVRGVPACGPRPGKADGKPVTFPGGHQELEWQCAEYVMRYMVLAYGVKAYPADGWNVVSNYPIYGGTVLQVVTNDGTHPPPVAGDILSYGTKAPGHASVVQSVNFDPITGTEISITVVEQNYAHDQNGVDILPIVNGKVANRLPYVVTGWLHYPGSVSTPTPTPTPTPTSTPVVTEFSIPTGGSNPIGITSGPDGALWFAESNANKIGRMPTSGSGTAEFPIPTSGSSPYFIAVGSDGALWFTEYGGNRIGRIPTKAIPGSSAQISEYAIPTSYSEPMGITKASDGAMWFVEYYGNNVGRIATDGSITEFPIPTAASNPYGIAAGSDGALWFTEAAGNKIGRIPTNATPGIGAQIQEFPIPSGGKAPYGITAGSDGALWFTEIASNMIGRITTSGSFNVYYVYTGSAQPYAITSGPDGAPWFTEQGGNKIGRTAADGTISETTIPTSGSYPSGITAGTDGALWFAESSANRIGRLK
jgi:virginiamycin B lyase